MKIVHVFRYSQVVSTNIIHSVMKFTRYTGVDYREVAATAEQEEKEGGIIFRYKTGAIDTKAFRQELNDSMKKLGGTELDDVKFDLCWNAMSTVDPKTMEQLYNLQTTSINCTRDNFAIHVIGNTNKLHHEDIGKQIQKLPKAPKINYTLSFEEKTLDTGKLKQHVEQFYSGQQPQPELCWHNEDTRDNAVEILGEYYGTAGEQQ